MESQVKKITPLFIQPFRNPISIGVWFIKFAVLIAITLLLFYGPISQSALFSNPLYGKSADLLTALSLAIILSGLHVKAEWARKALLQFSWLSISAILFGLLYVIGYFDVSQFNLWNYLFITIIFLWNIWTILFVTKSDVIELFKTKS